MEFNCEGQNGGNNRGIMMYNYGWTIESYVDNFWCQQISPLCVRVGAHRMANKHHRICYGEVVLMGPGHGGFWFLY